jgi:hypothetical protein
MKNFFKSSHKRTHSKVDGIPQIDANDNSRDVDKKKQKNDNITKMIWEDAEKRQMKLYSLKITLNKLKDHKDNYERAAGAFYGIKDKKMGDDFKKQAKECSEAIKEIESFFKIAEEKKGKGSWPHEKNMFIDYGWEKLKKSSNCEVQFQIEAIEKDIASPSEHSSIRILDTIHGNLKLRLDGYTAYFQELGPQWLKIAEQDFIEGVRTYISTLPEVVDNLKRLVTEKQNLYEMYESNSDSFNQSQTLIDNMETELNRNLKVLAGSLDKTDKIQSVRAINAKLKEKHNIPENIDLDLELLQSTFKKSEKLYSSSFLEETGLPEQQMMDKIHESIEKKLLSAINIRAGYKADNQYILEHDSEAFETKKLSEGQCKQLLENSRLYDTNLTNSGKRPKSNLDYELWNIP